MKIFKKWEFKTFGSSKTYKEWQNIYDETVTVLKNVFLFVRYQFKTLLYSEKIENIEVLVDGDAMIFMHKLSGQILDKFEYRMSNNNEADWADKFDLFWQNKKNIYTQVFIKGEDLNFQLIKLGKIKGLQKYILMSQLIKSRFSPQEWVCPLLIKYPQVNTQLLFITLQPSQTLTHHFLILKNLNIPISFVSSFDLKAAGEVCAYLKLNYLVLKDIWIFMINKISLDHWQMYLIKNGAFYFVRKLEVKKRLMGYSQKFSDIVDQVESCFRFAKRMGLSDTDKSYLVLSNFDENFDDIECFESMACFEKIQFETPVVLNGKQSIWSPIRHLKSPSQMILYIKNYMIFSGLIKNKFKIPYLEKNILLSKIFKGSFSVLFFFLGLLLFFNLKDATKIYWLNSEKNHLVESISKLRSRFSKQQHQNHADLYAIFLKKYDSLYDFSFVSYALLNKLKYRFDIFDIGYLINDQQNSNRKSRLLSFFISPKFFTYSSDLDRQYEILFNTLKKKSTQFGISEKSIEMKKVKIGQSPDRSKDKDIFKVEISLGQG